MPARFSKCGLRSMGAISCLLAAASALLASPQGVRADVVDGFTIQFNVLPSSDITDELTPTSLTDPSNFTEATSNPWGATNPFTYSSTLNGSEYDAIREGSATYDFGAPQSAFSILWGTIDPDNSLSFNDPDGNLIGTIVGADLISDVNKDALGPDYDYNVGLQTVDITVFPSVPFEQAVIAGGASTLTFEYSNIIVTAVPEPAALCLVGVPVAICLLRRPRIQQAH